jgi:hypothetical protein
MMGTLNESFQVTFLAIKLLLVHVLGFKPDIGPVYQIKVNCCGTPNFSAIFINQCFSITFDGYSKVSWY